MNEVIHQLILFFVSQFSVYKQYCRRAQEKINMFELFICNICNSTKLNRCFESEKYGKSYLPEQKQKLSR